MRPLHVVTALAVSLIACAPGCEGETGGRGSVADVQRDEKDTPSDPAPTAVEEEGPPPPEEPPRDRPIEELLAAEGEDPGAVYYTSRIRELLHEGNPTLARELFRRLRNEHPRSVLVEEARLLFEEEGERHEVQ